MNRGGRDLWSLARVGALFALLALLVSLGGIARGGMGDSEPATADPAADDSNGYQPSAILAGYNKLRTVATGSTSGYDGDLFLDSDRPGAATGWWSIAGRGGTRYTIDSCGSSYPVRMVAYDVEPRSDEVKVFDRSVDACAEPMTGRFYGSARDRGPDVIRIDDGSGGPGGDYVVNYERTPVRASAKVTGVGIVTKRPVKGRPSAWQATVEIRVSARGESPLQVRCRLDGGPRHQCYGGVLFKRVLSGSHRVTVEASNPDSGRAKDVERFRVPRRNPKAD